MSDSCCEGGNVKRGTLILLAHLLAVSCLRTAMPASAKEKGGWKSYGLGEQAMACTFMPHSRSVAVLLYGAVRDTDQEFVRVYTTHLAAWDFKAGQVEVKRKWDYTVDIRQDGLQFQPNYMNYTADGRHLVFFGWGAIQVLDAETWAEVRTIAFEEPEGLGVVTYVAPGFSVTLDGSRAAVAFSSSRGDGGAVRVYDLRSGEIVREWRLGGEVRHLAGVAISPGGERVAVSTLPAAWASSPEAFIPPGMDNVRVMDVSSGETLFGMNTKYFAGPVLFGPGDTLLTASINVNRKFYSSDTVKVWDARTGKLRREIANPGDGVRYRLDLSADGKLLLGFTGIVKPDGHFIVFDSHQFKIWDFETGREVVASPKLPGREGEAAQLQLSPDEGFVVAWWNGFANPVVYEIPRD
jgi:hypothetical protein